LNSAREPNKAKAFKEALGYDHTNADALMKNILENVTKFSAVRKAENGFGILYEVRMTLIGANGKLANVITAWTVDNETREARLTSAYVTKKRIKEADHENRDV
jgi:hypothetical protein